ncbi:MAG: ribonuclease HII [Alphaproteobacteria bacterium]|nr:ribonuclease HII [Alphaproteobacteria bacterium]
MAISQKQFDLQFGVPVCGIDEVGRGPLVGPVVSACVTIPSEHLDNPAWDQITDSKKISAVKREKLFEPIKELCVYGIAEATAEEIDTLNIHHATLLAMKRAYHDMLSSGTSVQTALVDGKFAPDIDCNVQTVIKGDSHSLAIGAASILAKVTRDRLMTELAKEYPYYAWEKNSGYGTKAHMEGLQEHGLTPYHRLSFAPCAALKNMPRAKSLK